MHVLCVRIDAASNAIPAWRQPSLSDLARESGWDRRTVQRHLDGLEGAGWISRVRPSRHDARTKHARVAYTVHIPEPRAELAGARGNVPPGRAMGAAPLALGESRPKARGKTPHRSSAQAMSSDADLQAIIRAIRERAGVEVDSAWAARVRDDVIEGRHVRDVGAYVARSIMAAPPSRFTPTPTPPTYAERMAELAALQGKDTQ